VLLYKLKLYFKFSPLIFTFYRKLSKKMKRLANNTTDIVIEGYPRSGNTFAYFLLLNFRQLNIAHHTHSLANIKKGLRRRLPVVVLIRNPYDAIASVLIKRVDFKKNINLDIEIRKQVFYYKKFYRFVKKKVETILICDFDILIKNSEKFVKETHNLLLKKDIGILFSWSENKKIDNIKKSIKYVKKQIEEKEQLKNLDVKCWSIPDKGKERKTLKNRIKNKVKLYDKEKDIFGLYMYLKNKSI